MTKTQVKNIIKADLTPKYERARDSVIEYVCREGAKIKELRADFKNQKQIVDGKENLKWREHYIGFFGYYDTDKKRRVEGTYYKSIPKKYHGLLESDEKKVKAHFTKEYKEALKNLVEAITDEIYALKPKSVESGYATDHDLHFIITTKEGVRRSYTINTIVAGGYIQVIHNRTLRKLHKGLAK